jgi:hypothetical protein
VFFRENEGRVRRQGGCLYRSMDLQKLYLRSCFNLVISFLRSKIVFPALDISHCNKVQISCGFVYYFWSKHEYASSFAMKDGINAPFVSMSPNDSSYLGTCGFLFSGGGTLTVGFSVSVHCLVFGSLVSDPKLVSYSD